MTEKEIAESNKKAVRMHRLRDAFLLLVLLGVGGVAAARYTAKPAEKRGNGLAGLVNRARELVAASEARSQDGLWVEKPGSAPRSAVSPATATQPAREREGVWVVGPDGKPKPHRKSREGVRALSAFAGYRDGEFVTGSGRVRRVLADDLEGRQHQKFILEDTSGATVLVAHSISIAPRLDGLKAGDTVDFSGEFRKNEQGGVIHWTHHDPAHRHRGGWLRWKGRVFD